MNESSFPSLVIHANHFEALGAFAHAQAEFLSPDAATVSTLDDLLRERRAGVVAHFYMDPELQGVLTACDWPHVRISDSLAMADGAVEMARSGMRAIVVLGVDFMSENVRAVLDAAGHADVGVYRLATQPIGCSLAESADTPAYDEWLAGAAAKPHALHLIYINTSLRTKGRAHARVPTITCTSSNVVPMLLQAAAQLPSAELWYGPDTYMGHNLRALLQSVAEMRDDAIEALHPEHDGASVRALLERLHCFERGVCIVHHMFGADVVRRVRRDHPDALVTAHLEVPGEMFALGLEAQRRGRGVVGSTSNILSFVGDEVREAATSATSPRLSFVLGTEAGMITAIVRRVRQELEAASTDMGVEVVFPVASDAIAPTDDPELHIVPGVAGGEGCSLDGGCATCPYMKMNSLDALLDVLLRLGAGDESRLADLRPRQYDGVIAGRIAADIGGEPILHMRHFSKHGRLPEALVEQVLNER